MRAETPPNVAPLKSILKRGGAPSTPPRSPAPPTPLHSPAASAPPDRILSGRALSPFRVRFALFPLLLLLLSLGLYRGTLNAGYVWDDRAAIVGNKDVHGSGAGMWRHDFWGADLTLGDSHKSYRPVTVLTYRLNHWVHGLRARGFHAGNVLVYGAAALAVFALALLLFDHWGVAAIGSALFAVQPVHVEGVASLVGRADCLCALLFVLAVIAALLARGHSCEVSYPGTKSGELTSIQCAPSGAAPRAALSVLSVLLGTAAALSKETGFTVFPVLVLLELIYVPPTVSSGDAQYSSLHGCAVGLYRRYVYTQCAAMGWALRGVGLGALATRVDSAACHPLLLGTHPKKARHLRYCRASLAGLLWPAVRANAAACARCALSAAALLLLLLVRFRLHGGTTQLYQWTVMENHISIIPDWKTRALSYAQTHWWYVFKLFYPRHLCFDYGYRCMPTVDRLADPRNVLPLLAYGLGAAVLCRALRLLVGPSFAAACASYEPELAPAAVKGGTPLSHGKSSPLAKRCSERLSEAADSPLRAAQGYRRGAGLLLCWLLVLLPLLPALNVLFPVGALLAERLLFMPSVGFCIGIADLLVEDGAALWAHLNGHLLWANERLSALGVCSRYAALDTDTGVVVACDSAVGVRASRGVPASLLLLLAPLLGWHGYIVVNRCSDWRSETALFSAGLQTCPDSLKALNNHGMMSMGIGDYEDALRAYDRARFLYPAATSFHVNSGIALQRSGRPVQAALMFERSLDGPSPDPKSHGYYGSMLAEWAASEALRRDLVEELNGDVTGAAAVVARLEVRAGGHMDEAIKRGFHPPALLHARASLALSEGDHATARHYLYAAVEENRRLLEIQARTPEVPVQDIASMANLHNQLGVALASLDDVPAAVAAFEEGLRYSDGARTELVVNLSTLHRRVGDTERAHRVLTQSLEEVRARGASVGAEGGIAQSDLSLAAAALNNLGLVQSDMGLMQEAHRSFADAMACLARVTDGHPEGHPFFAAVAQNLQ